MAYLLSHNRYIIVFLFISWSMNAQVALPTFQATHYVKSGLYSFSSHTFTNCGATGKNGPTLSNCTSAYSPSWTDDTDYFNVPSNAGIQYWTVPKNGTYTINASGAQGARAGGRGARMIGNFNLTKGEIIKIAVGQIGVNGSTNSYTGGGGGGGTFVIKHPYNSNASILVIAGGGGGRTNHGSTNTIDAVTTSDGGDTYNNGGGTDGDGGDDGQSNGPGAGGGGFFTNGENGTYGTVKPNGGKSFINGLVGGTDGYTGSYDGGDGGFGGGGGGLNNSYNRSGGGGGYSGGQGGTWSGQMSGGGGGSYNSGSSQSNTAAFREDHGQVIITIN